MLNDIKKGLSHLVYPSLCEGCSKQLLPEERVLCLNCNIYNLPRTAYHHIPDNETAMRFAGRVNFQKATSFAYFTTGGLLQHLLHELKYNDKKYIGYYLGQQLGYDLQQTNWHEGVDIVIPVPLHPKKEAQRGFNQSLFIAEGLANVLQIPINSKTLTRAEHTESQTQKTREERIMNMKGAFSIQDQQQLEQKHILIIDDVLTTGATLESCILALQKTEGVKVSIATIGIAN